MPDNLTPEQRSKTMAHIRRRDTRPELELRRALCAVGLRGYRLDVGRLPGRPDIAWIGRRVAVFVDGAFWHGHPSAYTPGKSGPYWDQKIERNIARDRVADTALRDLGWVVIRLWDFEIKRSLDASVARIVAAYDDAALRQRLRPGAST